MLPQNQNMLKFWTYASYMTNTDHLLINVIKNDKKKMMLKLWNAPLNH